MYNPDRVFMKDLKKLDPKLGCYFERNHHHFVITYDRAIGGAVPIMVIEGEGGGFRQPDRRDILKLQASDTHRVSVKERLQATALYMERVREKQRRQARDNIRNLTRDDKLQLGSRFARLTGGKHNATFRRVNLKRRGRTADELQNAVNY